MTSSSPSSSPASSPSSSAQSVDELLSSLIDIKAHISTLQARYDALIQQLDASVRDGVIPLDPNQPSEGITFDGYRFTHQTRRSYTFPPDHPITRAEKRLKAEKELAIALGEATLKATTFWSVRELKGNGE